MATKLVNGEPVEMTAEEEAAFEAERAPRLNPAKDAARARIQELLERAEGSFPYAGKRYQAAFAGRIALLANAARASAQGFPVLVIAADGSEAKLNRTEYQAFEAALIAQLQACSARAIVLRDAVRAATDVAAVLAIDIEAGWP